MYNKLNFYLMYFHINDFNLNNFRDEIISLFKNNDPIYNYDFQVNNTYYIHIFTPSGEVISKLTFELLSINDEEDIIEDFYFNLFPDLDVYLKGLEVLEPIEYPNYIGLYISLYSEDKLNPEDLLSNKDNCLSNSFISLKKDYINSLKKRPLFSLPNK